MRVLVPYATRDPKSRLSPVLTDRERREFALAMLCDVVDAVRAVGYEAELLVPERVDPASDVNGETQSTAAAVEDAADVLGALPQVVDDRPLSVAVNAALDGGDAPEQAVVMADLALATPTALRRLFGVGGDVAVAPGRGGGTNALVVRDPDFSVDYHGASYRDHRRIAAAAGLSVGVVDSMRLATDVDDPADLAEVLLHGDGRAAAWLVDAGFSIDADDGRVGVERV
ncbi:2-phospho-L-lactate guanylyltransferase [Halobellus rufus]|uniref:2-phospho-L-lactate guanylyltransferase n=1 Tax=Halobellus rufus TaxID=1448860 RepID=UPI00067874FA|nr:2-phospho-L-lactate guanylyltransferase [Halobellus rufus]